MNERWKKIHEFDYAVSNLGRVKRLTLGRKTFPGKILSPLKVGGYRQVCLVLSGETFRFYIHRLVMAAFVGSPPEECEVNHKDGDKANNILENLEYVTRSQNMLHAVRIGLVVPKRGSDHHCWKGGRIKVGRPTGAMHWSAKTPERIARGERSGKNKITFSQVQEIKSRALAGEMQITLAAHFGLSKAQICRIIKGDRWKHEN